jgi:hypothetical protein
MSGNECTKNENCCSAFIYHIDNIPEYSVNCLKVRVQSNGFYDYECSPVDSENNAFTFPVFVQYSIFHEKYFVTKEISLAGKGFLI